jgi:hypothetical protein
VVGNCHNRNSGVFPIALFYNGWKKMKKVVEDIVGQLPALTAICIPVIVAKIAMEDALALRWIAQDKRRMRKFRIWLRKELVFSRPIGRLRKEKEMEK